MSIDDTPDNKITPFSSIPGGKKGSSEKESSGKKSGNAKRQIYVTDPQFKNAMNLIRDDMNNALQLGNLANTQHYFLVKFLVEKGIIDEDEFSQFMQQELEKPE